jgi:hypothetical protein
VSEINNDETPVYVTGEERKHPALRMLARACIQLARLRLEQEAQEGHAGKVEETTLAASVEPQPDRVEPENGAVSGEASA